MDIFDCICERKKYTLHKFRRFIERRMGTRIRFFELMEPINGQWRIDNGTNSSNLIADSDPTMDPVVITLAALVGAPILLAAVAPPQLPVFPPQGVPQPGSLAEGGGLLPASAIIVRKIYIYYNNF